MKILVVDDNATYQQSARDTLANHDLTVVGTYDEAQALLAPNHNFEVVLCDLLLPASGQSLGTRGEQYRGKEMPVGIFLALLAARNGADYVAVLTDANHHQHPASACFDAFNPKGENRPNSFMVEKTKFLLCNGCAFADGASKDWGKLLTYLMSYIVGG